MGEQAPRGTLYVVVCAAPPAAHVQDLVKLAQAAGWEVAVTAPPGGARVHRRAAA